MNLFYSRIYNEHFSEFSDNISENRKTIIDKLRTKKKNHIYKFSDEFLYYCTKIKKPFKIIDFHIDLFKDILKERDEERFKLKSKFISIKDKIDLSDFLNISYGFLVYVLYKDKLYTEFSIPKKNGGTRIINAPNPLLENIQKKILIAIKNCHNSTSISHGFEEGKNIITNAEKHTKKKYVYNIDIKDFFPTINFGRVFGMFYSYYKFEKEVATILAQICTYNGFLPQGAPTSPIISNIICFSMDLELKQIAKLNNVSFTRYADDITFSSRFAPISDDFKKSIKSIIEKHGFKINSAKERIQHSNIRQEVTGLVVNEKVNIKRSYIREIRAIFHTCRKVGLVKAGEIYNVKYPGVKFQESLYGKINFIGSIRGKNDKLYQRYLNEYKLLFGIQLINSNSKNNNLANYKSELKTKKKCNHIPQNTSNFFKSFSDYPLKFLTHDTDFDDILSEIKKCKDHVKNLEKRITNVAFGHVFQYLIEFYEDYAKKNKNNDLHPIKNDKSLSSIVKKVESILNYYKKYPFVFGDAQKKDYKFSDLVNFFKKSYKFGRPNCEDETNIEDMFNTIIKNLEYDNKKFEEVFNKPKFKGNSHNPAIYTDIFRFYNALKKLFEQMIKYQVKANGEIIVYIDLEKEPEPQKYIITIVHLDSKVTKDIDPYNLIGGDFKNVISNLWSICNWQIVTEFENFGKIYKIDILNEEKNEITAEESSFEYEPGFTNIFTFYK